MKLTGDVRDGARVPPTPIVEAHYIRHDFFLRPGQLLANADRLKGIPGRIVQGRYDLLCPPQNAHALATAWPDARLEIIDNAGHAMTEPGIMDAMRRAHYGMRCLTRIPSPRKNGDEARDTTASEPHATA